MTRSDRVLQPRIDCFAFQRQHAKYALVDTAERLTADKAFEGFDLGDCLCHFGDYLSLVVKWRKWNWHLSDIRPGNASLARSDALQRIGIDYSASTPFHLLKIQHRANVPHE